MGVGSVARRAGRRARADASSPRLLVGAAAGVRRARAARRGGADASRCRSLALVPLGAVSVTFAAGRELGAAARRRARDARPRDGALLGRLPRLDADRRPLAGWLASTAGPRAGLVLGGVAALVAGVVAQRAFARGIAATRPPAPHVPAVALATARGGTAPRGGKVHVSARSLHWLATPGGR